MWDCLWSARRHARIDILDVALFDENSAGDKEDEASSSAASTTTTPAGTSMRWLFTAKDGRVMKKSSHNTNLGALKQAFLDRVLVRRESSAAERRSSRIAGTNIPAGGGVFATALLGSGESVPLDEDTWTAVVVKNGGRNDGAVAVAALAPATDDAVLETSRRGGSTPQRFTCEYTVKPGSSSTTVGKGGKSTTYVLVSPGLLRDANGQQEKRGVAGDGAEGAAAATAMTTTLPGERLVSRVKATNREVEARLGRIVQWVQEVRNVHVLCMAAIFTMVPFSGSTTGKPGVWLEQVLHVRMIPKDEPASSSLAPITESRRIASPSIQTPPDSNPGSERDHLAKDEKATLVPEDGTARQFSQQGSDLYHQPTSPSGAVHAHQHTDVDVVKSTEKNMVTADLTIPASFDTDSTAPTPPPPPLPTTMTSSELAYRPGKETQPKSTRQLLSAAANAVISAGRTSATATESILPAACDKCSGDFCSYRHGGRGGSPSPEHSAPKRVHVQRSRCSSNSSEFDDREGTTAEAATTATSADGEAQVDWTDVGMSDGKNGAALLEFKNKQQGLPSADNHEPGREEEETLFSLTFKSVGLARSEAKRGQDSYWGEELRRCWREGSRGVASGLQELSPTLPYREVRWVWLSGSGIVRRGQA